MKEAPDAGVRTEVLNLITKVAKISKENAASLEPYLWRQAESIDQYKDPNTLKDRLKTLVKSMKARKESEQLQKVITPAEMAPVPAPVFPQVPPTPQLIVAPMDIFPLLTELDLVPSASRVPRDKALRSLEQLEGQVLRLLELSEETARRLVAADGAGERLYDLSEEFSAGVLSLQSELHQLSGIIRPGALLGAGEYLADEERALQHALAEQQRPSSN